MGLYWVPGHAEVQGNEIVNELARGSSALKLVGPEPALGVSRQDMRRRIRHWSVFGFGGEVLVIPKDRLENSFRDPVWVPRLCFCPLTGHNPGLLLAFLLDIIP